MVSLINPTEDDFFGVDSFLETLDLEPSDFEQAIHLTQALGDTVDLEQSYQAYQNILASTALARWFEMQGDLTVEATYSTAQHWLERTCCLKVGDFRVYGLAVSHLFDETLELPGEIIDDPHLACHLYALVEVSEEDASAIIRGFLRYDKIQRCQQLGRVAMDENTMGYELPVDWINFEARDLFLYLRCADPAAFGLPTMSTVQLVSFLDLAGVVTSHTVEAMQQVVNTAYWLQDHLDEISRSLHWYLYPAFAPNTALMRSATETIDKIVAELKRRELAIPANARAAHQDFDLNQVPLRLYSIVWPDLSEENLPEWNLVLVLGVPTGGVLPDKIKLQVRDNTALLDEKILNRAQDNFFPSLWVTGNFEEQFYPIVSLATGETIALPIFAFQPNQTL